MIGLDVVGSFARFLVALPLAEGFALFRTRGLRPILPDDDTLVALRCKVGRRRERIRDQTRRISRLRRHASSIRPGLERTPDLTCKGHPALLTRTVTLAGIGRAGQSRLPAHLKTTRHLHGTGAPADRALETAWAQEAVVPGEAATAGLIPHLAASPTSPGPLARHGQPLEARQTIARSDRVLEGLLADHPDGARIRSPQGMGAVLAAEFVACIGDIRRFGSADAPASAAAAAPVGRRVPVIRTMIQGREAFDLDCTAA